MFGAHTMARLSAFIMVTSALSGLANLCRAQGVSEVKDCQSNHENKLYRRNTPLRSLARIQHKGCAESRVCFFRIHFLPVRTCRKLMRYTRTWKFSTGRQSSTSMHAAASSAFSVQISLWVGSVGVWIEVAILSAGAGQKGRRLIGLPVRTQVANNVLVCDTKAVCEQWLDHVLRRRQRNEPEM